MKHKYDLRMMTNSEWVLSGNPSDNSRRKIVLSMYSQRSIYKNIPLIKPKWLVIILQMTQYNMI